MGFLVYRNGSRDRLLGDYATLDAALATLGTGNLLVVPQAPAAPVPLAVDGLIVEASGGPLDLVPASGLTKLTIGGTAAARVDTGSMGPLDALRLAGPDAGLTLAGGVGRDLVTGGAGRDRLDGGAGNDDLAGRDGDDLLIAGTGRDRLHGDAGDDWLVSGSGAGDRTTLEGGAGADVLVIPKGATGTTIITDFDPLHDRLVIDGAPDLAGLLAAGAVTQGAGQTVIRWGGAQVQLLGTDAAALTASNVAGDLGAVTTYASFDEFLASGTAGQVDTVTINGVEWHRRDAQPLHQGFKGQDAGGDWWSPDYLVVVAAGQSNMTGAGRGGAMTLSGNVVAWDWVNDALIPADYSAAPANGPGVRTGTTEFNNLYYPFAEELSAATGQPVMVVAHPVSGSQIETWVGPADTNWDTLDADVTQALAAIGQDTVDTFLWLQGESDYPDSTTWYEAQVYALIDQVRAAGWGDDEVAVLIGELSREGVNQAQNAALQRIELAEQDPYLAFVSSTGLAAGGPDGVHFTGEALVEYGHRYAVAYEEIMDGDVPIANTAPTLAPNAPIPVSVTVAEGQRLVLDMSAWFADAEGDALWYYGTLSKRGIYLIDPVDGGVAIDPDYAAAGTYTLRLYASDYLLDGPTVTVTLTVTDAAPGMGLYGNGSFATALDYFATFDEAMAGASKSRGLDILTQGALSPGGNLVTWDSLTVRAAAGIAGELVMADGVGRLYLDGAAGLSVKGSADDNYVTGSAGANALWGRDGVDRLYGNDGADTLWGEKGADTLTGGNGGDRLVGGQGNDVAYGGAGADTIVFEAGGADLRLRDWQDGTDVIEVAGFGGVRSFQELMAAAKVSASSTVLTLALGTDRLILDGATLGQLTADDFAFA